MVWKRVLVPAALAVLGVVHAAGAQCTPAWSAAASVPGVAGEINALLAWDPDGPGPDLERLVVGGSFDTAGDTAAQHVAIWDGHRWEAMASGLPGPVSALAVYDGQVIACGGWASASQPGFVRRWGGGAWTTLGVVPVPAGASPTALAVVGGELYLASGGVWRWDGSVWMPASGIDRVATLGAWNGTLVAIGRAGGVNGAYRWTGSTWLSVGDGIDAYRAARLVEVDQQLYLTGELLASSTEDEGSVFRLDTNVWTRIAEGFAGSAAEWNGRLHVAGFTRWTSGAGGDATIASYDGAEWTRVDDASLPRLTGWAAMTVYRDRLVAAGTAPATDELGSAWRRGMVMELGPSGWAPIGSAAEQQSALVGRVLSAATFAGSLHVGGAFVWPMSADGLPRANQVLMRRDGRMWRDVSPRDSGGLVRSLTSFESRLIVAGSVFGVMGDESIGLGLLSWDGLEWRRVGELLATDVGGVAVWNGRLVVAGLDLQVADGPSSTTPLSTNVAMWDGQAWKPLSRGPWANEPGAVVSLFVWRGELMALRAGAPALLRYAGGAWLPVPEVQMAFQTRQAVAYGGDIIFTGLVDGGGSTLGRYDGVSVVALDASIERASGQLRVAGPWVIFGGSLTRAGGSPEWGVWRWDGSVMTKLAALSDQSIMRMAEWHQQELVVAGDFTRVGGDVAIDMARLGCECYANCDGSAAAPVLNALDFACFFGQFQQALALPASQQKASYANCDGSGVAPVLNALDFSCFLGRYVAGCP